MSDKSGYQTKRKNTSRKCLSVSLVYIHVKKTQTIRKSVFFFLCYISLYFVLFYIFLIFLIFFIFFLNYKPIRAHHASTSSDPAYSRSAADSLSYPDSMYTLFITVLWSHCRNILHPSSNNCLFSSDKSLTSSTPKYPT